MSCFSFTVPSPFLIQSVEQVSQEQITNIKKEVAIWKDYLSQIHGNNNAMITKDFISVAEEIERPSSEKSSLYFVCKDKNSTIQAIAQCAISYQYAEPTLKIKQILSAPWNIQKIMKKAGRKIYSKGCGTIMLHALFHLAKTWGVKKITLFSSSSAEGFYRKIGMHRHETSGFSFSVFDRKDTASINAAMKKFCGKESCYDFYALPTLPLLT